MATSITPAQLALRFGCELIPVQIQRIRDARFRVIFHASISAPDSAADNDRKALEMTSQINNLFESWIREHPTQWMCTKRRWPKHLVKPDYQGKPPVD
jgi:KDO2-lipid IV(A) lauroyltransferase